MNGEEVPYSRYAGYDNGDDKAIWGYDGYDFQVKIYLPASSADVAQEIVCVYDEGAGMTVTEGQKGIVKRITAMTPEAKLKFAALKIKDFQLPSELMSVAQCGSYVNEDPFNASVYLNDLDVDAMIENINSWEKLSPDFKFKISAQTKLEK